MSLSLSPPSLSLARGLFFATGENVYICLLPATYASPDASHKERFIVWLSPLAPAVAADGRAGRISPSSRRVAAGDKTATKLALLITAGVTGLHLYPDCSRAVAAAVVESLSESR